MRTMSTSVLQVRHQPSTWWCSIHNCSSKALGSRDAAVCHGSAADLTFRAAGIISAYETFGWLGLTLTHTEAVCFPVGSIL